MTHIQTKHECYTCEHSKYEAMHIICKLMTHIQTKHEHYTCEHS